MRTKFKAWAEPYINEHPEYALSDEEISALDNLYLEIGSGKGDFLLNMSEKFTNRQFLGIEKNVTCEGIALKKLVEAQVNNVKFLHRDAAEVVRLIKDNSVSIIYLNFSDPWPKRRHYKRRLTSIGFLGEYKRILNENGCLIFKTDNEDLFDYSLEMFEEAGLKIKSVDRDYDGLDKMDAQTEYEEFFRKEGTPIKRVVVTK